jgi:hypothetical protein
VKNETAPLPYAKERKYRRFELQFPVRLSYAEMGKARRLETTSQNVSIGGLLLKASDRVEAHTQVKLTLEVRSPLSGRSVRLNGEGEVIRVEAMGPGAGYAIAVECKRPISRMGEHLEAAG